MLRKKLLLFIILLSFSIQLNAQHYWFRHFGVENGFSRSGVYSITEDNYGRLLIGTEGGGISIFDGKTFNSITKANGLPDNNIRSTFVDFNNFLWVATESGGAVLYTKKGERVFDKTNGLPNNTVRAFCNDLDSNVWIATLGGGIAKYNYKSDSLEIFDVEDGLASNKVRCLLLDTKGVVWIGTDRGLCKYVNNEIVIYSYEHGFYDTQILSLYEDQQQNIWAGTRMGAVCLNPETEKTLVITTAHGLQHNRIKAICDDVDGNIWMGTKNGLSVYNPSDSSLFNVTEDNGLSNNRIRCLYKDSYNTIWIGTYFGGINQLIDNSLITINKDDGLKSNHIYSIIETQQGELIIGSVEGLSRLKYNSYSDIEILDNPISDSLNNYQINCIYQLSDSRIVLGTNFGLRLYDEELNYLAAENYTILSICQDHNDRIWLGTPHGLFYIVEKEGFKPQLRKIHIAEICTHRMNFSVLFCDSDGIMWAASNDGDLLAFDNYQPIYYNIPASINSISSIQEDNKSNLWVSTIGNGLFKLSKDKDKLKIKQYTSSKDSLFTDNIQMMIIGKEDNIYLGSEMGVELLYFDGDEIIKRIEFGVESGLFGIERNGNAIVRDKDNRLWIGTTNGLKVFDPNKYSPATIAPLINIISVKLNSNIVDWEKSEYSDSSHRYFAVPYNLVLPFKENNISIDFSGISYTNPELIRYKYRLLGSRKSEWFITKETNIKYPYLPAGKYTFEVLSTNESGLWSETPALFEFTIKPPFYQTWWFISLCVILGLSLIIFIVWNRQRLLEKKNIELEKQVVIRTKQITKEKARSEELLLNILPNKVAQDLMNKGKSEAEKFDDISVFFSDFVGFTKISSEISPVELIEELNIIFTRFDEIMLKHHCYRVKTIGDAYMAVCGLPNKSTNHAKNLTAASVEILNYIKERTNSNSYRWKIRIGIHSGAAVAGIVGVKKYLYDIFGDTINTASRMESNSKDNRINVSEKTRHLLKDEFQFEDVREVDVKGKGLMKMYFLKE